MDRIDTPPRERLARGNAHEVSPATRPGNAQLGTASKETVMTSAMTRAELTGKLLGIKRENDWTWKHICAEIGGMSPVLITGAHSWPDEAHQAASGESRRIVRL